MEGKYGKVKECGLLIIRKRLLPFCLMQYVQNYHARSPSNSGKPGKHVTKQDAKSLVRKAAYL